MASTAVLAASIAVHGVAFVIHMLVSQPWMHTGKVARYLLPTGYFAACLCGAYASASVWDKGTVKHPLSELISVLYSVYLLASVGHSWLCFRLRFYPAAYTLVAVDIICLCLGTVLAAFASAAVMFALLVTAFWQVLLLLVTRRKHQNQQRLGSSISYVGGAGLEGQEVDLMDEGLMTSSGLGGAEHGAYTAF